MFTLAIFVLARKKEFLSEPKIHKIHIHIYLYMLCKRVLKKKKGGVGVGEREGRKSCHSKFADKLTGILLPPCGGWDAFIYNFS